MSGSLKYLITGASGQLGTHVINTLLETVPASEIGALVRREDAAAPLKAKGVTVRIASYDDEAALTKAFSGVERLLLISSSEVGKRAAQHSNVISAAIAAGIGFIAYTSLLRADTSPLTLPCTGTYRHRRRTKSLWSALRHSAQWLVYRELRDGRCHSDRTWRASRRRW